MSVKVSLGAPLAERIGGRHKIEMDGATVGEVLENLSRAHEPLASLLWRKDGQFNPVLAVFRNKDRVVFHDKTGERLEAGMDTPVAEGDEIAVISALEGG